MTMASMRPAATDSDQIVRWFRRRPNLATESDKLLREAQERFHLGVVESADIYQEVVHRAGDKVARQSVVFTRLKDSALPPTVARTMRRKFRPDPQAPCLKGAGKVQVGSYSIERLGLGAMRLLAASYKHGDVKNDILALPRDPEKNRHEMLNAVHACGIDYVDFARGYGPWAGAGEGLFRDWMSPYPERLLWATKVGYERNDKGEWGINLAPKAITDDVKASRQQLGARIPLLYLVANSTPDVAVRNRPSSLAESLAPLIDAQAQGLVRHIGLANIDIDELRAMMELAPIAAVQNKFTLASLKDPKQRKVLEFCRRRGIPFVAWGVLDVDSSPPPARDLELGRTARVLGITPPQLTIALLLHAAPNMVVLTGASRRETLYSSVDAAKLQLSADVLERFGVFPCAP